MMHTVIEARRRGLALGLRELYAYRDLFLILAYRDLRVRYAQTLVGLVWAFLQPAATLAILTVVFGRAIQVDTGDVPYPLFALAGMIPWVYFSFVLSQSGSSIIGAQEIVRKVYFPRLVIPLSKAVVGFVDLAITLSLFLLVALYYRRLPPEGVVWLPLFFVAGTIASLAVGTWLSALTIRFRDFQHVVPFLVQTGFYATPVAYPASVIPERFRALFYMNPMAGVVDGFRWALLGASPPPPTAFLSLLVIVLLFASGLAYFRYTERYMADFV